MKVGETTIEWNSMDEFPKDKNLVLILDKDGQIWRDYYYDDGWIYVHTDGFAEEANMNRVMAWAYSPSVKFDKK